jgi:hypothetical protein
LKSASLAGSTSMLATNRYLDLMGILHLALSRPMAAC